MKDIQVIAVGHVDHGKSTLLGRLLYETGSVPEARLAQIRKRCKELGRDFEFAFILDALQEEQTQNITIDLCRFRFRTPRRSFVMIDAPGHKEFLKNMVSGAASADAAILLVDAAEGMREQTRRHAYLLRLLGVQQIVVAINKLDKVGFSQSVFQKNRDAVEAYLGDLGVRVVRSIPMAALEGENIVARTDRLFWYTGPTFLEQLEELHPAPDADSLPVRFPIQDIYEREGRGIAVGRLESGTLRAGDRLTFWPSGAQLRAQFIAPWNGSHPCEVRAGQSLALELDPSVTLSRGEIGSSNGRAPRVGTYLRAHLFWLGETPLQIEKEYTLRLTTVETSCRIAAIEHIVETESLAVRTNNLRCVNHSEVAALTLETRRPVPFDLFTEVPSTGRIVLVDNEDVAGGGILS